MYFISASGHVKIFSITSSAKIIKTEVKNNKNYI